MKYAYNLDSEKVITAEEWIVDCNVKGSRLGLCAVCLDFVILRTPKSGKKHFVHRYTSRGCLVKQRENSIIWVSSNTNKKTAKLTKEFVLNNSYSIFDKCRSMAEGLTTTEFLDMVRTADKVGMWYFDSLPVGFIPYILLTYKNKFYKSESRTERKSYFYFTFPWSRGRAPNLDRIYLHSLWRTPTTGKRSLIKISPRTGSIEEYWVNSSLTHYQQIPNWFESTQESLKEIIRILEDDL